MHSEIPLIIAGVMAAGVVCQWIAWRIRVPAILPLLFAGFLAGPVLNILHPHDTFGELFFPTVSLAVSIILFEGALTLNWREVRTVVGPVRNLLTVGALISWFGGALGARFLVGLPWDLALLFGALIIVTGPTVIAPILRNVRPTANIASILKWEGIIIDPIGALIAVLVFEYIVARSEATIAATLVTFVMIVVVGVMLGLTAGVFIAFLLHRYLIPDYLRDISILATVVAVFALSNALAPESGLTAVTVMGIYLANTDLKKLREVLYFKEKLSVLLISTLFILLAANVTLTDMQLLDWRSFLLVLLVMLVLRPVSVFLSTMGSTLSRNEKLFLSWIAPRGIVAAAVSSLFGFTLVELGYADAAIIAPLIFLVIMGTVLVQGGTAKPLANWLGVSEADPQGFLIMGADRFAREFAKAIKKSGVVVRLIDNNWNNVASARLDGLDAVHGNILSEFVEGALDLSGIGRLLAMTSNDEANALACKHFEEEFGSSGVYQLPPKRTGREQDVPDQTQLGRLLFAPSATCYEIGDMLDQGAGIKSTPLTEKYTWADFQKDNREDTLVLMTYRGQQVNVPTVDFPLAPQPGWTVISLVPERSRTAQEKRDDEHGQAPLAEAAPLPA